MAQNVFVQKHRDILVWEQGHKTWNDGNGLNGAWWPNTYWSATPTDGLPAATYDVGQVWNGGGWLDTGPTQSITLVTNAFGGTNIQPSMRGNIRGDTFKMWGFYRVQSDGVLAWRLESRPNASYNNHKTRLTLGGVDIVNATSNNGIFTGNTVIKAGIYAIEYQLGVGDYDFGSLGWLLRLSETNFEGLNAMQKSRCYKSLSDADGVRGMHHDSVSGRDYWSIEPD